MDSIGILTDSCCGISAEEAGQLGIKVLPMAFFCEEQAYYEGINITREEFFGKLTEGKMISTSQPSPEEVMEFWRENLTEYDKILYMPLSSGLSGACSVAGMLAEEEEFAGRVLVVDHGRIATPLHSLILDAAELIKKGFGAQEIKEKLECAREKMSIYIAVETLEYLKRGGRITPATAAIGTLLNIKPVLKLDVGVLDTFKKCRGTKKARKEMLEALKRDLETRFKEEYEQGRIHLLAASTADKEVTEAWIAEISEHFPGMEVLCDDLTLAVACHTGEGALGVGCSCKIAD